MRRRGYIRSGAALSTLLVQTNAGEAARGKVLRETSASTCRSRRVSRGTTRLQESAIMILLDGWRLEQMMQRANIELQAGTEVSGSNGSPRGSEVPNARGDVRAVAKQFVTQLRLAGQGRAGLWIEVPKVRQVAMFAGTPRAGTSLIAMAVPDRCTVCLYRQHYTETADRLKLVMHGSTSQVSHLDEATHYPLMRALGRSVVQNERWPPQVGAMRGTRIIFIGGTDWMTGDAPRAPGFWYVTCLRGRPFQLSSWIVGSWHDWGRPNRGGMCSGQKMGKCENKMYDCHRITPHDGSALHTLR